MARRSSLSKLFARLPMRLSGAQEIPEEEIPKPNIPELTLLFFIIDWDRTHIISDVFAEENARLHFISKGQGTATSEMLHLLGVGAIDKAVIICMEQAERIPALIKNVRKKLGVYSSAGIAFTVPFSAINSPVLRIFRQNVYDEKSDHVRPAGFTHNLLIATINQGFSGDVMNTARAAGAMGGTIINARRQHEEAAKFFGISVQDERELILMLTNKENTDSIMQVVSEAYGLESKAQGIVISLPVERMMSLSLV